MEEKKPLKVSDFKEIQCNYSLKWAFAGEKVFIPQEQPTEKQNIISKSSFTLRKD